MPTLEENLEVWNKLHDWPQAGDEWSREFGGTEALWFFVLYPRIHRFLPAANILEIAPGFGRWTEFLKRECQSLIGVDISEQCIDHCRHRFASDRHLHFYVNDGTSLDMVPDHSIDFVFSFDSLVHAEKDVVEAYIFQLARKLADGGVGFLHHSNIGSFPARLAITSFYDRLPARIRKKVLTKRRLSKLLSINLQAWRAKSMTAQAFRECCERAGLKCIRQETLNWRMGDCPIDAMSVFTRTNSRWDTPPEFFENRSFVTSAALTSRVANLYCRW